MRCITICIFKSFVCMLCLQTRRWNRSHNRYMWAILYLLGKELRTSGETANAPNYWTISPAHNSYFKSCSTIIWVLCMKFPSQFPHKEQNMQLHSFAGTLLEEPVPGVLFRIITHFFLACSHGKYFTIS